MGLVGKEGVVGVVKEGMAEEVPEVREGVVRVHTTLVDKLDQLQ